MNKILLLMALSTLSFLSMAQEVGVRGGNTVGNPIAFDAVFELGQYSRMHGDVSFGDGLGVELLYDFFHQPVLDDKYLSWYMGFGASTYLGDVFGLGANGEIGLELQFDQAPLSVGMDWRPVFWFIEETDFASDSFGINIRYRIGSH